VPWRVRDMARRGAERERERESQLKNTLVTVPGK